jgi:hypothetical protein
VVKPVGVEGVGITEESASGSFGVNTVDFDFLGDHIHTRFASPHRNNPITTIGIGGIETPLGKKEFLEGRNYQAVWHVGWAE